MQKNIRTQNDAPGCSLPRAWSITYRTSVSVKRMVV